MSITQKILEYAGSLFDVVGMSKLDNGDDLLILGLESTAERDLDEFGRMDGELQLYGFKKYFNPLLESLLNFLHKEGFSAEPVGRYGYPRKREVNLKEMAIKTGIGKRGKSTVILHPEYGTRLRFAAITTEAPLSHGSASILPEGDNPVCAGCTQCIDECPVNALEPYFMPDISICLSNTSVITEQNGRLIPCDICLKVCPAKNQVNLSVHPK